jgi:basic amino acid/polyamine antiporter, APA family
MTQQLQRELGIFGAVMMGLGSIVGTGIFVSVGISAGIAGSSVLLAIAIAAVIAAFNGFSSAQLAANHPVSGGTYEYGYKYLNPQLGFIAGWSFLLAKSASAATAALGFSGYLLNALGQPSTFKTPLALVAVVVLTLIVLTGIRRSNTTNTLIVSMTLFALAAFVITGLPKVQLANLTPLLPQDNFAAFLQATALMFVAYTGYGRIATLGEEVREPERTIPRAIIITLLVTMVLYMAVSLVGVGTLGATNLGEAAVDTAAPLEAAASTFNIPFVPLIVAVGAITAMLGVLLNLLLGLSRVLLAMGRRGDMPAQVAKLDAAQTTPYVAVIVIGVLIGALVLTGNVRTTWSFSAFTVLIYYSLTNLAALQLTPEQRLYPRWLAWAGLAACLFLAFWVEVQIWIIGMVLLGMGLIWQYVMQRRYQPVK